MASLRAVRSQLWTCPSCALQQPARAAFSTTAARQVGPESPHYIDVPEPPQQQKLPKRSIKGRLPVPRDLFKANRGGTDRVTDEAIDALTQSSQQPLGSTSQAQAKYNEWRQRMSETRKRNLREGLLALKQRRLKQVAAAARQRAEQEAKKANKTFKGERRDEYLTRTTIAETLKSTQRVGVLPDPNREQRLAEMAARVEEKNAVDARKRQDALHTLYLRARNFIVSEEHLNRHVEEVFGSDDRPRTWGNRGPSIWSTGRPSTLKEIHNITSGQSADPENGDLAQRVIRNRLRKIAGKLTGGEIA